jgi:hypothetical protein
VGQPFLQRALVVMAQGQVMGQVAGAGLVGGIGAAQERRQALFTGLHGGAQRPKLLNDPLAFVFVPGIGGGPLLLVLVPVLVAGFAHGVWEWDIGMHAAAKRHPSV